MNWQEPRVGPNPLRFVEKVQGNGVSHHSRKSFAEEELQRLTLAGRLLACEAAISDSRWFVDLCFSFVFLHI